MVVETTTLVPENVVLAENAMTVAANDVVMDTNAMLLAEFDTWMDETSTMGAIVPFKAENTRR